MNKKINSRKTDRGKKRRRQDAYMRSEIWDITTDSRDTKKIINSMNNSKHINLIIRCEMEQFLRKPKLSQFTQY